MANRAYVGNLPFTFTSADLQELFGPFGAVKGAEIVMDRMTGRSRGFGFVEMETAESLKAAMSGLDGKSVDGRNLTVNEARERAPRPPGSGPRPGGDRPYQGGGDRGGAFAPRGGPGPRGPGGPPRSGGGFSGGGGGGGGGFGGGGGPPRRGTGRPTDRERSDRLERPEKGRDDRWRYTRGGEDEE